MNTLNKVRLHMGLAVMAIVGASQLADAATVEATRDIRRGDIIQQGDVTLSHNEGRRNEAASVDDVVGMEARSTIRRGRAVRFSDLRAPTLVERNQLVDIIFRRGSLVIRGEGRALRDGGRGERVRVMNLDSRTVVTGRINAAGQVEMSQ